MASPAMRLCRLAGCGQSALNLSAGDSLCLDHFLEQTFSRAKRTLELCQQHQQVDAGALEWLLAEARIAAQILVGEQSGGLPAQREKLLELLLCLTNLQEYVRHHSVRLNSQR